MHHNVAYCARQIRDCTSMVLDGAIRAGETVERGTGFHRKRAPAKVIAGNRG